MRRCGRLPYVNAALQRFNIINIAYAGFCQRRFGIFNLPSAKQVVSRRTDVQQGGECRTDWKCFAQRFFITSQKTWSFLSVSIIFKLYYIRSTRVFGNINLIPFLPNRKLQTASCTGSVENLNVSRDARMILKVATRIWRNTELLQHEHNIFWILLAKFMWFNLRECENMVAHEDRGLAKQTRLGGCIDAGECVLLFP
jgi:hypothetical protein